MHEQRVVFAPSSACRCDFRVTLRHCVCFLEKTHRLILLSKSRAQTGKAKAARGNFQTKFACSFNACECQLDNWIKPNCSACMRGDFSDVGNSTNELRPHLRRSSPMSPWIEASARSRWLISTSSSRRLLTSNGSLASWITFAVLQNNIATLLDYSSNSARMSKTCATTLPLV